MDFKMMKEGHELHMLANEIRFPTKVWLEKDILELIDKLKIKAIKDICKNMNVKSKTLCQFGTLGLMTVEELVETFYGEELKSQIQGK